MNGGPLQFLQLGDGERSAGEWEVVSILPRVTFGRILVALVLLSIVLLIAVNAEGLAKAIALVPLLLVPLPFLRARETGWFLLTNRRLIHYHRVKGLWRDSHHSAEVRIGDISGLRAHVEHRMGVRSASLAILTRTHDAVIVSAVASAIPILSSLPVVGRLFRDSNMGAQAMECIRDLYARVREIRAKEGKP